MPHDAYDIWYIYAYSSRFPHLKFVFVIELEKQECTILMLQQYCINIQNVI